MEVVEFSRKHTANVHEALSEIRQVIEALVRKRDERRDGFAKVIQPAMETKLGDDADEVQKVAEPERRRPQLWPRRPSPWPRRRAASPSSPWSMP